MICFFIEILMILLLLLEQLTFFAREIWDRRKRRRIRIEVRKVEKLQMSGMMIEMCRTGWLVGWWCGVVWAVERCSVDSVRAEPVHSWLSREREECWQWYDNMSTKLPLFGLQQDNNGRDPNHNDKTNPSFYSAKTPSDSSIAALEAFQREYLPRVTGALGQRLPSTFTSSSSPVSRVEARAMTPPSPSFSHQDTLHPSHNFDEQFKDVSDSKQLGD